jgi:hypothetical protein
VSTVAVLALGVVLWLLLASGVVLMVSNLR